MAEEGTEEEEDQKERNRRDERLAKISEQKPVKKGSSFESAGGD